MLLSVLNTRLPFRRPTDAKSRKVTGDALSSTVVSTLPLTLSPCPSHLSFKCLLSFQFFFHMYMYSLPLILTRSPIRLRLFFSHIRLLACTLAYLCSFACSQISLFFSFHSRRLVWPGSSDTIPSIVVTRQTFVPLGTSAFNYANNNGRSSCAHANPGNFEKYHALQRRRLNVSVALPSVAVSNIYRVHLPWTMSPHCHYTCTDRILQSCTRFMYVSCYFLRESRFSNLTFFIVKHISYILFLEKLMKCEKIKLIC